MISFQGGECRLGMGCFLSSGSKFPVVLSVSHQGAEFSVFH